MSPFKPTVDEYWSRSMEELLPLLDSSLRGLSAIQAEEHLQQVGLNQLQRKKRTTAVGLFLNQFKSLLKSQNLLLLCLANQLEQL